MQIWSWDEGRMKEGELEVLEMRILLGSGEEGVEKIRWKTGCGLGYGEKLPYLSGCNSKPKRSHSKLKVRVR
jgi:hypothetical protein